MTDTSQSEPLEPQTNGVENGIDEDDRAKMRPADIDADVKEMERRKRVEMIMNSRLFREELERIIELQMKDGNGPAGLLQQISDMMGIQSGKLHTTHMFRGSNCVTPINDIRGVESMGYAKGEKNLRCKLASVFRLMDLYGWSQGIHNQITARLNQDEEHFLVNPYGMLYNEITASSLVKVDMQGNIVETGTTNFNVNMQGFLLHSSIHAARPDVKCIIHIHTPSVLAVSSLKCGLLPLCQEALVIGEVSQHPFVGGSFEPEEREKIIRNLGPSNKVLLLNNHGAVCCGSTVEEAFYNVYNTVLACETQIKLMPIGIDNLVLVNDETRKQVYDAAHRAPETSVVAGDGRKAKQFRVGELEFEALIRMLDNAGFRTGYIYRHPLVKGEVPKPKNDVEVPPAVSSLGYLIEEEEMYRQGNWKKYIDGRNRLDRTKWLNSPNVYQKVEILETGTPDPKKITKWVDQNSEEWVAEGSPTHSSTPVKIESALQFVPKGTNPKEFKKLQQQIKINRLADKITSGPQSHILEGVTWEEAKKLQDANITQTGDQVILVGAASKGIIQRNFQHNALVYKTPYAKNPFDCVSDKEIEDYKRLVERKQKGDTDYEESQSESEAMSSSRQDALRHIRSPLLSPQSATSETEEESRDEPRVLRIETKTAPRPIQAEVVLSDAEFDATDARVERSQSARYPKPEKPESVTIINSFRKSWSLKRDKDKSKDFESSDDYDSRYICSSPVLVCGRERTEPLSCIARISRLNVSHKAEIVNIRTEARQPLLNNPTKLYQSCDDRDDANPNTDEKSDLRTRLYKHKRHLQEKRKKFLGLIAGDDGDRKHDITSAAISWYISEIRDTISEIISPNSSKVYYEESDEPVQPLHPSMRWISRPVFVPRDSNDELNKANSEHSKSSSYHSLPEDIEDRDVSAESCKTYVIDGEKTNLRSDLEVIESVTREIHQEDLAADTSLHTYSFTETTDTEWYYNKTGNSQTVLEIKQVEKPEPETGAPIVKCSDTGIDTDFTTSDKESDLPGLIESLSPILPRANSTRLNSTEETEAVEIGGDNNKSPETDSSNQKSSSGKTSNDVDTSFAFKTDTENSEKNPLEQNSPAVQQETAEGASGIKLPDISESPEFADVDTEDAPVTYSSNAANHSSVASKSQPLSPEPEVVGDPEEQFETFAEPKPRKKKKNRSSTMITVKKELMAQNATEPLVSEIKLTIKNNQQYQSEKYELEIQSTTNTSEDMSRTASSMSEEGFVHCDISDGSCECGAQQNLDVLQSEVVDTIEKLCGIENYFEEEIKKASVGSSVSTENADERVFECSYQELGEMLSNSQQTILPACAETEKMASLNCDGQDIQKESSAQVVKQDDEVPRCPSSEIEVPGSQEIGNALEVRIEVPESLEKEIPAEFQCEVPQSTSRENASESLNDLPNILEAQEEFSSPAQEPTVESNFKAGTEVERITMSECASTEINEERTDCSESDKKKNGKTETCTEEKPFAEQSSPANKSCNNKKRNKQKNKRNKKCPIEVEQESNNKRDNLKPDCDIESTVPEVGTNVTITTSPHAFDESVAVLDEELPSKPEPSQRKELKKKQKAAARKKNAESIAAKTLEVGRTVEVEALEATNDLNVDVCSLVPFVCDYLSENVLARSVEVPEIGFSVEVSTDVTCDSCEKLPLKTDTNRNYLVNKNQSLTEKDEKCVVTDKRDVSAVVVPLLEDLIDQVFSSTNKTVNDVAAFILNNPQSPTHSLTEFEDLENVVSVSDSLVTDVVDCAENHFGDLKKDILLEQELALQHNDTPSKKAKKSRSCTFNILIATPTKKEIFINYSPRSSSCFDLSSEELPCMKEENSELCNSYIKGDDVNDDFEDYSVNSSEWYSANSSIASASSDKPKSPKRSFVGFGNLSRSPRSLEVIFEDDDEHEKNQV